MRYENHRAFKILQRVHQHLFRGKIEVIRRFVEHQEVRRVVEHARYCQTRFFSAGECADLLIHVFAGELECSRQVPQRPDTVLGKILLQVLGDGEVGIEQIQSLLSEVAHIQAGAEPHASGIWSTGSGNHFKKRSLTCAVSSHDGPAFSAADGEIESIINYTRAVTLCRFSRTATCSPDRGGTRNSNFTTTRFFGISIFSILSSALIRLCTWAALAACVLKRSMKRCSLASMDCCRANAAC